MTQTVHTPSPELFMAMPQPDEELETEPDEAEFVVPVEYIAAALMRIEDHLAVVAGSGAHDTGLREAYADLEAKHAELYALLEEIEGILKPSTSKLANTVREAITRWRAPVVPEPETTGAAEHPSHDAPVEEWREYARTVHGVAEGTALDQMNRSQLRSALGIEQPGTPVAPTVVHS